MTLFDQDPYPGKPKILFVAQAESSHTIDWINLMAGSEFNVRLFAVPHGAPPKDWPFRSYITGRGGSAEVPESNTRQRRFAMNAAPPSLTTRAYRRIRGKLGLPVTLPDTTPEKWLIEVLEDWQPDLIQTLSMTASGWFLKTCRQYGYQPKAPWMLMIWGGPDIVVQQHHPVDGPKTADILTSADYVFSDTEECMEAARGLGVKESQIPEYYLFPGAGGVDVDRLAAGWQDKPPSQRRILLWPKSYTNYYMSGLVTLEALKLCWQQIQPCEIVIPNMKAEVDRWFWTLPEAMRLVIHRPDHMPHSEFQALMMQTRVMLAPSLLDGMPNVLVDALACGAFPIVSPLGGLTPILNEGEHTLFARNLYVQEIADAIVRAMTDDALVDAAAQKNLALVRRIADRDEIRRQVLHIYQQAIANAPSR